MNEPQTVLIVDDEPKIQVLLTSYLETEGFHVLCASNGDKALALFDREKIDAILLDIMLPGLSGEEVCLRVRKHFDIPIIMMSARTGEENIIRGLNIGACDYICKPFSPRELMARLKAALRRSHAEQSALLSYAGLQVNTDTRSVSRNGAPVLLTRDEYRILTLLMSRPSKTFTRDEILSAVKGDEFYGFDRSVDSHIKRLRAKIEDDPKTPCYIITVYGIGYRLGED